MKGCDMRCNRILYCLTVSMAVAAVLAHCAGGGVSNPKKETIQGITMISLPAGQFLIGTEGDYKDEGGLIRFFPDERPAHTVTLSAFQIGETEITQKQYETLMGENPSFAAGENLPVTDLGATQALVFCNKLSEAAGLEPCYDPSTGACDFSKNGFRLPTEAEWEYACRAESRTSFSSGDAANDLDRVGWYAANSGGSTHPVAQKKPNAWGLYDMHGNVWECCYDGYDEGLPFGNYTPDDVTDPTGHNNFNLRIIRGGSYTNDAPECRSAVRGSFWTGGGCNFLGFRVARSIR